MVHDTAHQTPWKQHAKNITCSKPQDASESQPCDRSLLPRSVFFATSRTPRKSRSTRRAFYQDIGLFWVQVRIRDGTVAHMMDNVTVQPTKWYSNSKKLVIQFSATSALSRGMLKRRKGESTIHFNGHLMNTELSFQTNSSVNQVGIHAAVTN